MWSRHCSEGTDPERHRPPWMPESVAHARQVVLLVVDGLGWEQLRARPGLTPTLSGAEGIGSSITSVAPTTTACALTSITTGLRPSQHGLLGYRLAVDDEILNVLRWTLGSGRPRRRPPHRARPPLPALPVLPGLGGGRARGVQGRVRGDRVHRRPSGQLPAARLKVPSSLPIEVGRLLDEGEPFVYAYYDGIDKVAHGSGLGDLYDAELRAVDRLVADLVTELPPGAVLVVTADHGEIDVGEVELLGRDIMSMVHFMSGEGRFRWLHARPGAGSDLRAASAERYGDTTWVMGRDELIAAGLFGGPLAGDLITRVGDVALLPHAPIAFVDPADTGENRLYSRHGSLTSDELLVPLVALTGSGSI